jgi:hypothetical protein
MFRPKTREFMLKNRPQMRGGRQWLPSFISQRQPVQQQAVSSLFVTRPAAQPRLLPHASQQELAAACDLRMCRRQRASGHVEGMLGRQMD